MGVALLALLIACSGAAVAAIPSLPDGTITACRDNKTGVLRVIDAASQSCANSKETTLTWKDGIHGKVADALHADQADNATNAANADTVDGKNASDFYALGSKVLDSAHADQADSATSAEDANTLGGKDSTQFANTSHTHSGGEITSGTVDADRIEDGSGSGLDADTIDGLDSSALQRRVSASCDPDSAIRAIGDDGTVTCEQDDGNAGQVNADDMAPLPAVSVSVFPFQPIASGAHTPFVFNTENFDQVGAGQTGQMHSATQPTRLVAPRTGLYQVNIHAFWDVNGTGVREIWFLPDRAGNCTQGSFAGDITNGLSNSEVQQNTNALFFLNQGSYIEVCGRQTSGVSLGALATVSMHYVSGV